MDHKAGINFLFLEYGDIFICVGKLPFSILINLFNMYFVVVVVVFAV